MQLTSLILFIKHNNQFLKGLKALGRKRKGKDYLRMFPAHTAIKTEANSSAEKVKILKFSITKMIFKNQQLPNLSLQYATSRTLSMTALISKSANSFPTFV